MPLQAGQVNTSSLYVLSALHRPLPLSLMHERGTSDCLENPNCLIGFSLRVDSHIGNQVDTESRVARDGRPISSLDVQPFVCPAEGFFFCGL